MPRGLSTCSLLLLSCLCALVIYAAAQEHYLRYDNATGQLHFLCPLDSDLKNNKLIVATFGRYNQRTTNGQVSRIANWYNNSETKYETTGKVVLNTRQYGLNGYLTDVRCEDSHTYYCSFHFGESNGRISTRLQNFTFTFEGPPSVSIERPQNVRPCPGDKLELKCRAFLGRQTNFIIWETRLSGGQFVLDTNSYINHSNNTDTKSCNYYAESTLSRDLTAADTNREWRCRLSYGQAAAVFVNTGFLGSCPSTTTEKLDEGLRVQASSLEKPQPNLTVVLATVIPATALTLFVVLAMMIVLRRQTKQVPPILLFPEGPPPSEYSFSAVAGRGLPPLPQVQSNDYHFSATIDKSSEPPPSLPPYYQHVENADQSVYVSMSAIPSSYDTASTSCSSARMNETGRLWEDSDDQGMRTERSESTYSNKEAIERAKMLAQARAKNYNTCFDDLNLLPLEVDNKE